MCVILFTTKTPQNTMVSYCNTWGCAYHGRIRKIIHAK